MSLDDWNPTRFQRTFRIRASGKEFVVDALVERIDGKGWKWRIWSDQSRVIGKTGLETDKWDAVHEAEGAAVRALDFMTVAKTPRGVRHDR